MKIQITNIDRELSEADLRKIFEKIGPLEECSLVLDKVTGKSKGFAFVVMERATDATLAIERLNGRMVNRKKIKVKAV